MDNQEDEIRGLIFEKIACTISEQDEFRLNEALKKSPALKKEWEMLHAKFNADGPKEFPDTLNSRRSWNSLQGRRKGQAGRLRPGVSRRLLSAAAIVTLLAGISVYFLLHDNPPEKLADLKPAGVRIKLDDGSSISLGEHINKNIQLKNTALLTGRGEVKVSAGENVAPYWMTLSVPARQTYKVKLPDQTEVTLNAMSSLRFPSRFNSTTREVYLQGEAMFSVSANKDHPFLVHGVAASVKVLGTLFNVEAYEPTRMTTSLVHGKVLLQFAGKEVQLKPGHRGMITEAGYTDQLFQEELDLSWLYGEYNFKDTKLSELVPLLNRWYDISVVFDNPSTANIKLNGVIFRDKPLSLFLNGLEVSSGIRTTVKANTVYISN